MIGRRGRPFFFVMTFFVMTNVGCRHLADRARGRRVQAGRSARKPLRPPMAQRGLCSSSAPFRLLEQHRYNSVW